MKRVSRWEEIKTFVSGVAYGSIDQELSQQKKRTYGFIGLIIAIAAQVVLAKWLIPHRVLLNILVIPFQFIGFFSLIYIVQGFTKYPYGKDSFWCLDKKEYVPFFIRARAFIYLPYVVVFILSKFILENYKNCITDMDPKRIIFGFILNTIWIILTIIVAGWLKTLLKKFPPAIRSLKHLIPDSKFKKFESDVRKEVFNRKEILFILIPFVIFKFNDIYNADATWREGESSGYLFLLSSIWFSFSIMITQWFLIPIAGSMAYIYNKIATALKILKNYQVNIFLFHPDGYAGLGKICELMFSFLTKIIIFLSIFTFVIFIALQTEQRYLVTWENVSVNENVIGNESNNLTRFLKDELDINWAENASFKRIDENNTIRIFSGEKLVEIIIIDKNMGKAMLKINDGRTYSLQIKEENDNHKIYIEPSFWFRGQKLMIGFTIITNLFLLLVFLYPLMEIRSIIKRKKEHERRLLLEKIRQKEVDILNKRTLKSEELVEIENNFSLINRIDAIPDWGIGSKQWLLLFGKFLLTFNGVVLQILIKYLNI